MSEPALKPDLFHTGTRWEHYRELLDIFSAGVEVLKHIKVKSLSDREKEKKLQAAVEMIEGRLNYITDFTQKTGFGSSIRRVVDGDVETMYRKMKQERVNDEAKSKTDATKDPANNDSEGPEAYTTK
jgi:saccharopine dehydrogenase-like NADP-dependent oxidoreductase